MCDVLCAGYRVCCTFANDHRLSHFKCVNFRMESNSFILVCTFYAFIFLQGDQKDFILLTSAFSISLLNLNICKKCGNNFMIMKVEFRSDLISQLSHDRSLQSPRNPKPTITTKNHLSLTVLQLEAKKQPSVNC